MTLPLKSPVAHDLLYPKLKQQLIAATGLVYYADKDEDLARKIGRRLASLGLRDCTSYLGVLRDPLRGPPEWDELIAEIAIGETHLFRHLDQFDALRNLVFPALIAQKRPVRRLRIWSAGCATGAEAYSIAILIKHDLPHLFAGWDVTILGTDINRRSLAQAREGRFDQWAFRGMPPDLKRDCFTKEGKFWKIGAEYKQGVSFEYHNLVEHSFPSLKNSLFAFDLIVCRNVMIYFGPDLMQKMIRQFDDCLMPHGWLLVGPAEPNMTYFRSFHAVTRAGATLYQKMRESEPVNASSAVGAILWPAGIAPRAIGLAGCLPATAEPPCHSAEPTLAGVRGQADRGEWEESARSCEDLLKIDKLNPAAHFYHGLILEQMNQPDAAVQSLRRAIYLDRQFIMAHHHLGLFLQKRGESRGAVRSFENALELLDLQSDTGILNEGDGITAGELKQSARIHIENLRERE